MSLISAVLTLTPATAAELPAQLGQATHAWFLDRVTAHDRVLAGRLHEPNQERPFTVSNLMGRNRAQNGLTRVIPNQTLRLRLTSYSPALSALMASELLPLLPATLSLHGTVFHIRQVVTDRSLSGWAGRETHEMLVQRCWEGGRAPTKELTLFFASPTVFRSQQLNVPLPLPRLVFEGLARRWNANAAQSTPPDLPAWVEQCVAVQRFRLQTRPGRLPRREHTLGFTGACTFTFATEDVYWMRWTHLLAAFSFYAGVGAYTTMGWGQCRPLLPRS